MTTPASTASAITDEQKALAAWVRDGIADLISDTWPMRKHGLEFIEASIRAIEINIPAKFAAPTTQPAASPEMIEEARALFARWPGGLDEVEASIEAWKRIAARTPAPAAPSDDARDGARYRWLRANSYIELTCDSPKVAGWEPNMLDNDIDAAIAASTKAAGGTSQDASDDWMQPHPPSRLCMCPACIPSFDDRFTDTPETPSNYMKDAARYRHLRQKGGAIWHNIKNQWQVSHLHYDAYVDADIAASNKASGEAS